MKAFKEYLTENKRTFDFRVRIADCELTSEILDKIERGLGAFDLADITKPKSQPIARTNEFVKLGPVARQQFEVKLNYPTTPDGVRNAIHNSAMIPLSCIVVRTTLEDDLPSQEMNPEQSLVAGEDNFTDDDSAQQHVGLKRVDSLLKELQKNRTEPQQVKNVNDAILAKSTPKEKAAKTTADIPQGTTSPVNTKNPNPRGKQK
jgi:hypothetical protein